MTNGEMTNDKRGDRRAEGWEMVILAGRMGRLSRIAHSFVICHFFICRFTFSPSLAPLSLVIFFPPQAAPAAFQEV
jgi:hypothetical protein